MIGIAFHFLRRLAVLARDACRFQGREADIPALMEKQQLRAIANYFHIHCGTGPFLAALAKARSLSENGELKNIAVWTEIAEEITRIEDPGAGAPSAQGLARFEATGAQYPVRPESVVGARIQTAGP
jgi:hypothetical protein